MEGLELLILFEGSRLFGIFTKTELGRFGNSKRRAKILAVWDSLGLSGSSWSMLIGMFEKA